MNGWIIPMVTGIIYTGEVSKAIVKIHAYKKAAKIKYFNVSNPINLEIELYNSNFRNIGK